ncbi:MAG: hypothetical protein ACRCXT_19995 [Paraclostridium sp.]
MKNDKLINFLYKEKRHKARCIKSTPVIILGFITCLVARNIKLKNDIHELSTYVEENNKYIAVSNLNNNQNNSSNSIESISQIIHMISDKNINYIQIEDNHISIKGYGTNPEGIKAYTQRLNNINNINNTSIDSINKEAEGYRFEIKAHIGDSNEI